MPTIVTTPGAANANSYLTVDEADDYNEGRPNTAWAELDPSVKQAALIQATMLMDSTFVWTGLPHDDVQALCWPRDGMLTRNGFPIANNVIPRELKNATAEYARQLAGDGSGSSDLTATNDAMKNKLTSLSVSSISLAWKQPDTSNTNQINDQIQLDEPEFAWLEAPDLVKLLLVPSWYTREMAGPDFVFRVTPN